MSAASTLRRGRARASSSGGALLDRCRIERVTGEHYDKTTHRNIPTVVVIVPSGTRCRLKSPTTAPSTAEAGEVSIIERRYELRLPWDVVATLAGVPVPLDVEDVVVIERSDDAWVVGRPLTLIGPGLSGSTTTRRVVVEDRSGASAPPQVDGP